jgi:A/G-specific adenine glycosylase
MRRPSKAEVAAFQSSLLKWFAHHGRRFPWRQWRATLYQLVLPELLLQRTQAGTVAAFLPQFLERFPSWAALATATEAELKKYLQPLGLWRRRSASLMGLARAMVVRGGRFPRERVKIEELPGVGQYIANAIMLFTGLSDEPLLDFNMARVLERCFGPRRLVDIRYDPRLQEVARLVVAGSDAVKLNWAILDLAALVCTRNNPVCTLCPLNAMCDFGIEKMVAIERASSSGLHHQDKGARKSIQPPTPRTKGAIKR